MAQVVTTVFSSRDCYILDVAYTAAGDVGGKITPPAGSMLAKGLGNVAAVPAHVWLGTPTVPAAAAEQRTRSPEITIIDATGITLDVVAAGGSALPVTRVFAVRDSDALSTFANMIKGATFAAAQEASDVDDDDNE